MQLGIGTYTYGWNIGVKGTYPPVPMDELDLVAIAGKEGIKLLQLGDNLPLHTFPLARRRALSGIIQERGMSIELGARKMTRDNLKKYILLSEEMNASVLRFLIDDRYFKPELKEIEQIIRSQRSLLKEKEIRLALENHDRLKAIELRSLIENMGYEEVGICLDTVNSLGQGEGIELIMGMLAPYTFNLHIKDFIIKRLPHQMGFIVEGCPVGRGMLDVRKLIDHVKQYDKCETAILEQWTVPENGIEQTIQKEKAWASESLNYLDSLFN